MALYQADKILAGKINAFDVQFMAALSFL